MNEKLTKKDFATCTVAYNSEKTIGGMLEGVKDLHNLVIISKPWRGEHVGFDRTDEIAKRMGAEVVCQNFKDEKDERNFGMNHLEKKGYKYILIFDSDEYYLKNDIQQMLKDIIENPSDVYLARNARVYWKKWKYYFENRAYYIIATKSNLRFFSARNMNALETKNVFSISNIVMHHFSYNRSKEDMLVKANTIESTRLNEKWLKKYWYDWKFSDNSFQKIIKTKMMPEEILGRYIKSINLLY